MDTSKYWEEHDRIISKMKSDIEKEDQILGVSFKRLSLLVVGFALGLFIVWSV